MWIVKVKMMVRVHRISLGANKAIHVACMTSVKMSDVVESSFKIHTFLTFFPIF